MNQRYRSLLLIAAAAAALAPLIACVLVFGHHRWTSQWEEAIIAFGWWAPEYPWDTSQGDGYWSRLRHPPRALRHMSQAPSDSDDVVSLHGLSLTLARGQYTASANDPVWLVLRSTLSHDAQGLPGSGPQDAPASWKLREAALLRAPDDLLLRADKSALDFTGITSGFPFELKPSSVSTSTARIIPYPDPANAPAGDLWQALWEATAVLYEHATITVGRPGWFRSGAGQWLMIPPLLSVRFDSEESVAAYADALRKLSENAPLKYLESAFDERAKRAWRQMGMDPQAAGYLAQDEAGRAAWIVGWYCTLHQRVPALLAGQASGEHAARWIVLADAVSQVLVESVWSPLAYDQLEEGRGNNADMAQKILASATIPPEFVKPLRTIVSRPGSAAQRSLRPISRYLLPALYLDNVARGSLGIAVFSCAAGLVGWWNLRRQARATCARTLATPESGRAFLVAVAAVLLVASATTVLEACNGLGQLNNFVYSVAGVLWLCSLIAAAGWLWVAELVRPQDQPEQDYQRRMAWLVGCAVVFAALLFLAKAGQGPRGRSDFYIDIMFWAANPSRHPLPWPVAWSVGLIAGASFVGFGVLRWRRWRRESAQEQLSNLAGDLSAPNRPRKAFPPLIHPAWVFIASVWLSTWLIHGPFRDLEERGRETLQPEINVRSPAFEAVQSISHWIEQYDYARTGKWVTSGHNPGLNPLTATLVMRTRNLGFSLVLVCAVLWAALIRGRRAWMGTSPGDQRAQIQPDEMSRDWLAGVTGSCLWLALMGLVVHGWCTLALAWCMDKVLS